MEQRIVDEMIRDLTDYFNKAVPDNIAYNQGLARNIIIRYSPYTKIVEGFALAIITDDLRSARNAMALTNALNSAMVRFGYVMDFISARGETDAKVTLGACITSLTDEDICALVALIFASPHYADIRLRDAVLERFNRTEGTSCRMALALALYQCGDDRQLKTFIRDGYLPDYGSSQTREMVAHMLMPQILKYVIEDCGTEGRGFDLLYNLRTRSPHLTWRRKIYND